MRSKPKLLGVLALFGCILIYGAWIYLTDFYYKTPQYTLGTRNGTSGVLRDVSTALLPRGRDLCGVLAPGQEKRYMDPPWPVPEKIIVTFEDAIGERREALLATGLPKGFHGNLTVIISQTNSSYVLS